MAVRILSVAFILVVPCMLCCPSRDRIISQIVGCKEQITTKPTVFDLEMKLAYCESLQWARDCASYVYRSCSAGQLLTRKLPDNIRFFESDMYSELYSTGCLL